VGNHNVIVVVAVAIVGTGTSVSVGAGASAGTGGSGSGSSGGCRCAGTVVVLTAEPRLGPGQCTAPVATAAAAAAAGAAAATIGRYLCHGTSTGGIGARAGAIAGIVPKHNSGGDAAVVGPQYLCRWVQVVDGVEYLRAHGGGGGGGVKRGGVNAYVENLSSEPSEVTFVFVVARAQPANLPQPAHT
jgi:hypothetical protein